MSDLTGKTLAELRALCKERGLPVTGNKGELLDRLTAAVGDTEHVEDTGQEPVEDEFTTDDPVLAAAPVAAEDDEDEGPDQNGPLMQERTALPGEPLPEALEEGYAPDATLLPDPDGHTDGAGDPSLREALTELLGFPPGADPTDQELIATAVERLADGDARFQQGREEMARQAAQEIVNTTGRGGTLVKRVRALAEQAHG
ncbi:SAP domain-containing protein [Nocardiopsis sp. FR26]|uniref:SAP domain-containing protein n=1 Tax=Nocardiopsis sp. FR26 TaxID=2605987 RepID=UPI00135A7E06|nr:SAP domain-containing protein [Nocardiopsis sp. FR26]